MVSGNLFHPSDDVPAAGLSSRVCQASMPRLGFSPSMVAPVGGWSRLYLPDSQPPPGVDVTNFLRQCQQVFLSLLFLGRPVLPSLQLGYPRED